MIAHWRARWVMLTLRERVLIVVMLALFATVLLWLAVVRPVNDALANGRAAQAGAVARAGRIDAAVAALRRTDAAAPLLQGALDQSVVQSATEAGFTLDSQNSPGPDRLAIAIGSARPTALFAWLAALEARGVAVDTIAVTPAADGTVGARMTLRAAR